MAARGKRRGAHEEEHVNHERWLVSYADMMTLLMVLFIVMFAISAVDQRKFAALKEGLTSGFGSTASMPISGGMGIISNDGVVPAPLDLAVGLGARAKGQGETEGGRSQQERDPGSGSAASQRAAAEREVKRLGAAEQAIRSALAGKGLQSQVRFRITERGLVVALISDDVFFDSASATIRPRGQQVLAAVGPVLRPMTDAVAVEGHANHLALTSDLYASNWELSATRAASVVRYLQEGEHLGQARLSATGYGSSRPLYPQDDPRSIRVNRRVDLVLISDQPAAVRSLLPRLGRTLSDL